MTSRSYENFILELDFLLSPGANSGIKYFFMEKLSEQQILEYLGKLDGWEYVDGAIETSFEFANFKEALRWNGFGSFPTPDDFHAAFKLDSVGR